MVGIQVVRALVEKHGQTLTAYVIKYTLISCRSLQAEGFEHVEKNSKKYTVEYVTGSVQYALMEYKSVYTHA